MNAATIPTQNLLFSFSDPQLHKDSAKLKFTHGNYTLHQNYQSEEYKPIGENAALSFKKKDKDDALKNRYSTLDAAYLFSDLFPEVTKEFSQLAPHQQVAHVYASDHLPNWVKAIRDTHLAMTYLNNEPIAAPPSISANLNLQLDVQDEDDTSQVWVSVNGIDGKLQELYPIIEKIRQNPNQRFAGLYRPFSSPQNEALFKALQIYHYSWNLNEKYLVCDQAASYHADMSNEEFKEFIHIITGNQTKIQEALAFFQKYPDKLKDPDYQTFFKILLLNSAKLTYSIIDEIKKNDTFSKNLAAFIENSYKSYRASNELQACTFLLQMAHQFLGYSPEQNFYKNTLLELRQLLAKPALGPEEKSVIYAELVAQLSNKEQLSEDEVKELIVGTAYLRQHPVIAKWADPLTDLAIRDSVIIHSKSILEVLKTEKGANQVFLNQILQSLFPSAKEQEWKIKQTGDQIEFVSANGLYQYAPLSRQLQVTDQETLLPFDLRNHPYFKKNFPDILQGIPCANNIYRFTDNKGQETLVKIVDNQLFIEQKRMGKWLRFIPSDHLIQKIDGKVNTFLTSRYLAHHFTHWQDPNDPTQLFMIDPLTDVMTYKARIEKGQVVEIRRLKDNARLGKVSEFLSHFENQAYVHQWFNEKGELIEIELPRFDLNFNFDPTHQRFICEQKKGYFLDLTYAESLGNFTHYLSLKNDEDKQLILIPKQQFQSPSKKEVLEPRYEINTQIALENHEKQTYLTYEINKKKQLVSSTTESSLYLAEILTLVQEYNTAANIVLKKAFKLSAYTEDERKVLEDFIGLHKISGDESGNALAIRSFVSYCLIHNSIMYQKQLSKENLNLAYENYRKYLEHFSHATALKLEKAEEVFLLKFFLDHQFDPLLFVRLKKLDPKYAQNLIFKNEENDIAPENAQNFNPFKELELQITQTLASPPNKKDILITRPGKIISQRLDYFLPLALNGSQEDKQTLRNYLPFLKYESSGKYFALALFLEKLLDHPAHFSLPPSNTFSFNDDFISWQKETLSKAYQLHQGLNLSKLKEQELVIPQVSEIPQSKLKKQKTGFTLHLLVTAKKEQQCLIMTSKSVQCLILKYIEKCEEHFKYNNQNQIKPFPEELILMRKVLNVLSTSGYPILDEVDTLLNILHETSFSVGESRSPNQDEIQLIAELYSLIYSDPVIKQLAKTESDPQSNSKAPVLTEQIFFQKFQRPLAEKFLDSIKSIKFETESIRKKTALFVNSLIPEQRILILDYLCHNKENVKESQAYYDTLDPDIQNLLALASEELCHLLPYTLSKNSDEKYGLDEEKGGIIAIPFSAAKTPSRGSQFANAFITMNYTFQIYTKKGISREIIEKEIKRLQGQAMKELQEGGLSLETTEAWKLFSSFSKDLNMTLFNYKEQELDNLVKIINQDFKTKQSFIQRIILPQLVLYDEKLSCNPLNLVGLLNKVIGFTGTLWNSKSMHGKLNPYPAEGTDGKTLSLLQSQSSVPVISVKAHTTEELLNELHIKNVKFNLIADSGGYCREWNNEKIAKYLAKQWDEPVVYYNKAGQQAETDGEKTILLSESKTSADRRKTFLDQSRTTGADVPQALDAVGIVTINENMLLRDLLQTVWRLRGLDKGQHVQFIVSEKVKTIINQALERKEDTDINYQDILKFTIHNQAKQQAKDNFKALKKELQSIPQMLLLGVLLHPDISLEQQQLIYHDLRSVWIQPAAQNPKDLFGKIALERDSELVVKEERKLCISGLNTIFNNFPWLEEKGFKQSELINNAELIIKRMENCLARQVISPQSDDDNTVEVEQELKTETETELQTESEFKEAQKKLGFIRHISLEQVESLDDQLFKEKNAHQPYFSLNLYFEQDEALKSYAKAFEGINLCLNVLQWPKDDPNVKDLQLFGPNRTPLHFVRLGSDGNVILLSQNEVDKALMISNLYHITNGILNKQDTHLVTPEIEEKIVKIKFLNGDSHYSKKELDILRKWLKKENPEKMQMLYHKHILVGFPHKAIQYQGSSLDRLFKDLCHPKNLYPQGVS